MLHSYLKPSSCVRRLTSKSLSSSQTHTAQHGDGKTMLHITIYYTGRHGPQLGDNGRRRQQPVYKQVARWPLLGPRLRGIQNSVGLVSLSQAGERLHFRFAASNCHGEISLLRREWPQEGPLDTGGRREAAAVHPEERPWQLEDPSKTRRYTVCTFCSP